MPIETSPPPSSQSAAASRGPIVILGMHRSGTSCVGNLLTTMGVHIGEGLVPLEADRDNPKGYFELKEIRSICDGILHGSGCDWWSINEFSLDRVPPAVRTDTNLKFGEVLAKLNIRRPSFIKEPRLCIVWPLLAPQATDAVFIHVWRDPFEVAQSLAVRNGFPIDFGIALWEAYIRAAHAAAAGKPSIIVSYNRLLREPEAEARRIVEFLSALGINGISMPSREALFEAVDDKLHRNQLRSPEYDGGPALRRLLDALESGKPNHPALFEPLSSESRRVMAEWLKLRHKPRWGRIATHALYAYFKWVQRREDADDLVLLATSGYFDSRYYRDVYQDRRRSRTEALLHFMDFGAIERRNPSRKFDTGYYLDRYPDVAANGMNPLLHFLKYGLSEARSPRQLPIKKTVRDHIDGIPLVSNSRGI